MYSQPWSPTPSTTASAPELRTAKRSPASPRKNARPDGRAVERRVARDHVLVGARPRVAVRPDRDHAARQALARVVVDVAVAPSARRPGASQAPKLCPAEPRNVDLACRPSIPRRTISPESIPPTVRSTLVIGSVEPRPTGSAAISCVVDRRLRPERRRPRAALAVAAAARAAASGRARSPSSGRRGRRAAGRRARPGRRSARCPSEAMITRTSSASSVKKRITCSGLPAKRSPQLRVLGRDPDRAGVEVADAHHDAAQGDQRRGRGADLLGARAARRSRRRGPCASRRRPAARPASAARCARASAASRPARAPTARPRDTSEDCGEAPVPPSWPAITMWSACAFTTPAATVPTPASAASFTEMRARRVRAAQVVDELLEVLDRVDVVVRRRRDQLDAGRRVAQPADVGVDLVARAAGRPRRAWRPGRP